MTPVNGNFDQMLRSALRTEVDSIEPAEGGLDRIRRRTHAPWPVRQASLLLTECADLARLIGIRLEPRLAGMRAAIAARGGLWAAFVGVLSSIVASVAALFMPSRRRGHMHRGGTAGTGGPSPERPRSNLAWLRPVLAVVGAVVIVVAGVFGLTQMRAKLVLELFPSNAQASSGTSTSSTGGQGPTLPGQSAPGAILPPSTQGGSPSPSPTASCSSSPNKQATPTPTPTVTTTPSTTPSDTPTSVPTDTTAPSPTATAATSALSLTGGTGIQTVVHIAPATTCASPAHSTAAG
jgi:hypothetical protein